MRRYNITLGTAAEGQEAIDSADEFLIAFTILTLESGKACLVSRSANADTGTNAGSESSSIELYLSPSAGRLCVGGIRSVWVAVASFLAVDSRSLALFALWVILGDPMGWYGEPYLSKCVF